MSAPKGQRSPVPGCRSPLGEGARSPLSGNRVTMSGFGAFLPRPTGQQSPRIITRDPAAASTGQPPGQSPIMACRQSPRTATRTGTDVKRALGTRGGVVRNQDGFEVFYGVGNKQAAPKMSKARDAQRDGFDVFYGIQNKDRTNKPLGQADANGTSVQEQQVLRQSPLQRSVTLTSGKGASQLEAQLSSRLGAPSQTVESATNSGARFVPVGRSVSDGHAYQYMMHNDMPASRRPDISVLCAEDVMEAMGDGEEKVQLGGSPQIVCRETEASVRPPLPSQCADAASTSSAPRIPKSLEVFSMSGRPQQQNLLPTGVTSFSVATPTASYVPAPSMEQPPSAASEAPPLARRQC